MIGGLRNPHHPSVAPDPNPSGVFEGGGDQGGNRSVHTFQYPPSFGCYTSPPSRSPSTLSDSLGNGSGEKVRQFTEDDKWLKPFHAPDGISSDGPLKFLPYRIPADGEARHVDSPEGNWFKQCGIPKGLKEDEWLKQTHAPNAINSGPTEFIPNHNPASGRDGHNPINRDVQYPDEQRQFFQIPSDVRNPAANYDINPTTKHLQGPGDFSSDTSYQSVSYLQHDHVKDNVKYDRDKDHLPPDAVQEERQDPSTEAKQFSQNNTTKRKDLCTQK